MVAGDPPKATPIQPRPSPRPRPSRPPLRVIAFGKRAAWILAWLQEAPTLDLHTRPHPSTSGLLQPAPGKDKGLHLMALRTEWQTQLEALLADHWSLQPER